MTNSIDFGTCLQIARNAKEAKVGKEQVERLAAAWEEFEVAAKPTHFDGETEFYSIESMVEAAWEVKEIAIAAMQPDAQAIRNEASFYVCPDDATALNYLESAYGHDFRCAVSCMMDVVRTMIKENDDEG